MTRYAWPPAFVTLSLLVGSCSSPPAGPTPQAFSVSGVVRQRLEVGTAPIGGARVEILSVANLQTETDAAGRYRLEGVPSGAQFIRASANGYLPDVESITLTGDRTVDFEVSPVQIYISARAVNVLSGSPLAGVAVEGTVAATITNANGEFLAAAVQGSGLRTISFTHPEIIARNTHVTVPGPPVDFRLIPTSFPIAPFDQMCRTPVLQRWVTAPRLIIVANMLSFTNASDQSFEVVFPGYTDEEIDELLAVLTAALRGFSGDTFAGFADVRIDRAGVGSRIQMLTEGAITVARFAGLNLKTGFAGFGRWLSLDGTVTGGAMLLDDFWDRQTYQTHLRGHELGHALGYQHVTSAPSTMASASGLFLTLFDREAGRIAFARPPGNQSPDRDPEPIASAAGRVPRWSVPVR